MLGNLPLVKFQIAAVSEEEDGAVVSAFSGKLALFHASAYLLFTPGARFVLSLATPSAGNNVLCAVETSSV